MQLAKNVLAVPDRVADCDDGLVRNGRPLANWLSETINRAKTEVCRSLLAGEFCYVITGPNISVPSFVASVATRLTEAGVTVAEVDLATLGQDFSLEQWYGAILKRIAEEISFEKELNGFWADKRRLSPLQRFFSAIRDALLSKSNGRLIIVLDNLDAVQRLPFAPDEFLSAIRACYNGRSEDPDLDRLSFCLVGTNSPTSLLRDTRTPPFNVGRRIELFPDSSTVEICCI